MKSRLLAVVGVGVVLAVCVGAASAYDLDSGQSLRSAMPMSDERPAGQFENSGARLETLWIFDADYSTTTGDNAGWTTLD
jgi:hypothetical protein